MPNLDEAAHLRAALNGVKAGLLTFDRALDVHFSSDRLGGVLGIPPDRLGAMMPLAHLLTESRVLDAPGAQRVLEACRAAAQENAQDGSSLLLPAAANGCALSLDVSAIGHGRWLAAFNEVPDRRAADSAHEGALHDPLTGLHNRDAFVALVNATAGSAARVGARGGAGDGAEGMSGGAAGPAGTLLLVNIDRFKSVNESLGPAVGDALLRLVAQRLRSVVRQGDVVARLIADEFAVLLSPAAAPENATLKGERVARRIAELLRRSYLVRGQPVSVSASIGAALVPQHGRDADALLHSATLALRQAKANGQGTPVFFTPEMDARARARRALEHDLRKALVMREFELHFQPQVDLSSGTVTGFEALLRWRHPERGMVSPGEFIPIAEEIGMIVPIGEWVLAEACREAASWPPGVAIAVNASSRQFENGRRFADCVAHTLAATGLDPSRLEVEITESVLLRDEQDVLATLHRLRALGVHIAMDDFGTGYSSLSQLHSFPFDRIKIDRSFVKDRADAAGQAAIIRAIAALGTSLGMETIAEGVETEAQLDRIRAQGCHSVQGYLFSKPVPAGSVQDLLASLQARQSVPA